MGGKKVSIFSHLCDQIGMADDCSDKESIVGNLCAHLHTGCAQVQVHLVVGAGNGGQCKIAHAVELQLESQRRLQVSIDPVFFKLRGKAERRNQQSAQESFEKASFNSYLNTFSVVITSNSLFNRRSSRRTY